MKTFGCLAIRDNDGNSVECDDTTSMQHQQTLSEHIAYGSLSDGVQTDVLHSNPFNVEKKSGSAKLLVVLERVQSFATALLHGLGWLNCMSSRERIVQTDHGHGQGTAGVKFSMACEDLQLSSGEASTTSVPCSGAQGDRASPLRGSPSQSTKIVLPQTPYHKPRSPAQDRASPEYSIYNEKRRGRPHVSKSIPGYRSQNALASNKPKHHKTHLNTCPNTEALMIASVLAPRAGEAQGFSPTAMPCSGGPLDSPGRTESST